MCGILDDQIMDLINHQPKEPAMLPFESMIRKALTTHRQELLQEMEKRGLWLPSEFTDEALWEEIDAFCGAGDREELLFLFSEKTK